MSQAPTYRRIVLKISGECLAAAGPGGGFDADCLAYAAGQIAAVAAGGTQIGVVVGAGNLIRGRSLKDIEAINPATADEMGMLATVMNALALRDALASAGCDAAVASAIPMDTVAQPIRRQALLEQMQSGHVVLLAGGTGSPFCTTDLGAAFRALQLGADAVFKATKVDGVYDRDPAEHANATKYDRLTYEKVLADRLGVMDMAAVGLCMENDVPILIFRFAEAGQLARAAAGENVGTLITA